MLRLSIDEREDEDIEGEVQSLSFVISEEMADQYGSAYSVFLNEEGIPDITVLN